MADTSITPASGSLVIGLEQTPSLSLTGGIPSLVVSGGATVSPLAGALAAVGFAATLVLGTVITPGGAALGFEGGTPVQDHGIAPTAGALDLSGSPPTLLTDARITPGAGALTATGAAPTLEVPGDTARTPLAGALTFTGAAPSLLEDARLTPQVGSAEMVGAPPTLVQGTVAEPSAGALALAGATPALVEDTRLTPAGGALTLTGAEPIIPQEGSITPAAGSLAATGGVPTLLQAALVTPSPGSLGLSGDAPGVAQGAPITPAAGSLALSGLAPELLHDARITPSAGSLVATGVAGSVQVSGGTTITPSAGALGFTGAAPTLELRTYFDFTRLAIRATLDAPAAAWDLDTPDISLMTGDDPATTIRLAAGFVDGSGVAQLVNQIEAGRVTGRSWAGARPGLSVRLRGLDAMDTLMRTQRAIRYVPAPPPAVLEAVAPAEGEPAVEVKVGTWTARSIATDLLAGTGLGLYWGVRDYTFHEEFAGVGSILALLRQLVAPWDIAPLGVDIRAQASLIRVTQRQLSPAATVSKSMAAGRFDAVQGERRQHPLIGTVVLEGAIDPSEMAAMPDEVETSVEEVKDSFDRVISRTEREARYRMPEHLLTWSREKVWGRFPSSSQPFRQVSEVETTVTLDDSRYGPQGPINQPLARSSVTTTSTLVWRLFGAFGVESDLAVSGISLVLKPTKREETHYTYDDQQFLAVQTTTAYLYSYTFAGDATLTGTETTTTRWDRGSPDRLPITTTRETFTATGEPTGSSTQVSLAGGYPPGGLRPPFQGTPVRLTATISSDPTAIPVRLSNRNLSAADLAYQLTLLQAASGVYGRPFRFSGPAMPWLAVGDVLEVTAYTPYVGAAPMALGPGLVSELAMTYTRATAELRAEGEAIVYEAA